MQTGGRSGVQSTYSCSGRAAVAGFPKWCEVYPNGGMPEIPEAGPYPGDWRKCPFGHNDTGKTYALERNDLVAVYFRVQNRASHDICTAPHLHRS